MDQQPQPQQPQSLPPQPVQASVQPQEQPTGQAPLPPAAPKKSKKPLVFIGIIAFVLVALIALIIGLSTRITISEEDYKQATTDSITLQASYDKVYDAVYEKMPNMVIGYQAKTDDPDVENIKTLYQEYSQKSEAFLKLNALKDGKIKKEHEQFFEKSEQFTVFMDGFFASVADLKETTACAKLDLSGYEYKTAVDTYQKAFAPCFATLDRLIDSKNTVIGKYNASVKKLFESTIDIQKEIQAAALAGDRVAVSKAEAKLYDISPDTATKPAEEAMLEGIDAIDMSNGLKSLQEALNAKAQAQ